MPGDYRRKSGKVGRSCEQDQNRNNAQAEPNCNEHLNLTAKSSNNVDQSAVVSSGQHVSQPSAEHSHRGAPSQKGQSPAANACGNTDYPLASSGKAPIYGALDLGTNNCRLLLARPNKYGFQVVDAFSRIIRLGEGVSENGQLSKNAMARTIDALQVCAAKLQFHKVSRQRLVATEACRAAKNSDYFLDDVLSKTGLELEIICQETEAKLAVSGCVPLIDESCDYVLVFDIGGGSSELIWLDIKKIKGTKNKNYTDAKDAIISWVSLPVGVVTLAEKFGGIDVDKQTFSHMVKYVRELLTPFANEIQRNTNINQSKIHFLGTSGTVTTVAGIHLCLDCYDRQKIDGIWMHIDEVTNVSEQLLNLSYKQRSAIPSVGRDRADLVLGGCAILEAMLETWPTPQLRVADRGLREGILAKLMSEDGFIKPGQCWQSQPKRAKSRQYRRSMKPLK